MMFHSIGQRSMENFHNIKDRISEETILAVPNPK